MSGTLSQREQKSVWDETERNFWVNFRSKKDAENKKIEKDFQLSINEVRELANVEAELACTNYELEEKANQFERIEQDYRTARLNRSETLQDIWFKMRRFFRQKRGEDPGAPDHLGPEPEGIVMPEALPELSSAFDGPIPRTEPTNDTAAVADRPGEVDEDHMEGIEHHGNEAAEAPVDVVSADGNGIGPTEEIERGNRWVEGSQRLASRHLVNIQERCISDQYLTRIYNQSEKVANEVSRTKRAADKVNSCQRNQETAVDCIVVSGHFSQEYVNNGWNFQRFDGASEDRIDILASSERALQKKQLQDEVEEASAGCSSETVHPTTQIQPRRLSQHVDDKSNLLIAAALDITRSDS
ncbi:hypothetical protein IL306_007203 [Fusarium sp. DS 682]|nr:hypothetical protein IL306_007203 [Fusarium sp. DS 682]